MMYETVFAMHIVGACVTGLVGAYSLVALWNNFSDKYRLCTIILGALAGFEILSGTALSILSLKISAVSLCSRIFLYLSLVALIEWALFARMKQISIIFPLTAVISPIAASLLLFLSALAYGF